MTSSFFISDVWQHGVVVEFHAMFLSSGLVITALHHVQCKPRLRCSNNRLLFQDHAHIENSTDHSRTHAAASHNARALDGKCINANALRRLSVDRRLTLCLPLLVPVPRCNLTFHLLATSSAQINPSIFDLLYSSLSRRRNIWPRCWVIHVLHAPFQP